jgi:hypothetical protein
MMWLLGFAAGYVVGARTEKEEFDDIVRSLRAIRDSEEVRDFIVIMRQHTGHALRGLADMVERRADPSSPRATATVVLGADLVNRVRRIVGED